VTIDTTNQGAAAGAGIRFAGTLGANALGLNDLKLIGRPGGNVAFNRTVFGIGALTISNAPNVLINASDGTRPAIGARSLDIAASGNVEAVGSISTDGLPDSIGGLQNAGRITIVAGGDVSLGSTKSLLPGVSAQGGDATTIAGSVAGNGGAVSITGATIELPAGFSTRGDDAIPSAGGFPHRYRPATAAMAGP
jgi:hypothetical protein